MWCEIGSNGKECSVGHCGGQNDTQFAWKQDQRTSLLVETPVYRDLHLWSKPGARGLAVNLGCELALTLHACVRIHP